MEKQGGIYARYSPGRDRDQTSTIEAQGAMCREKAQREGIAIVAPSSAKASKPCSLPSKPGTSRK